MHIEARDAIQDLQAQLHLINSFMMILSGGDAIKHSQGKT